MLQADFEDCAQDETQNENVYSERKYMDSETETNPL
jgi:hypothetical protein